MEIRFAKENDNKLEIASLLYQVDPYIYPYWFKNNAEEALLTLGNMLGDKSSIFYYKNFIIAKDGDSIIGIFCFVPKNICPSRDYTKWDVDFESHHVITNYIYDVIDNLKLNDICVLGIFVDPRYRRNNIASKMFDFLLKNVVADTYTLEVLADNVAALSLYKKFNFNITKTYRGYNGYKSRKPLCHIMTKQNNAVYV